jgi:hypothetical protein
MYFQIHSVTITIHWHMPNITIIQVAHKLNLMNVKHIHIHSKVIDVVIHLVPYLCQGRNRLALESSVV